MLGRGKLPLLGGRPLEAGEVAVVVRRSTLADATVGLTASDEQSRRDRIKAGDDHFFATLRTAIDSYVILSGIERVHWSDPEPTLAAEAQPLSRMRRTLPGSGCPSPSPLAWVGTARETGAPWSQARMATTSRFWVRRSACDSSGNIISDGVPRSLVAGHPACELPVRRALPAHPDRAGRQAGTRGHGRCCL
jgi:hypothetical protein